MKLIVAGVVLCLLAAGVCQVLIWQNSRRERERQRVDERRRNDELHEAYRRANVDESK